MKINPLILLAVLSLAVSCQSTASSQRSVSIVGLVPMSGTSTETAIDPMMPMQATTEDVERSGAGLRLENRDGAIGMGVELRQATYETPSDPTADSDGTEIAGFFRRYLQDSNNSAFIEASPILGLGLDDGEGNETSAYALLRLSAGYRWMLAEDIFIDADAGYYMTLITMDTDTAAPPTEEEVSGFGVSLGIGLHF
jgi:hypothetical protein